MNFAKSGKQCISKKTAFLPARLGKYIWSAVATKIEELNIIFPDNGADERPNASLRPSLGGQTAFSRPIIFCPVKGNLYI